MRKINKSRAVDVPTTAQPNYQEINRLIAEHKIDVDEWARRRDVIYSEWKTKRYRICAKCKKKKLRSEFVKLSKYCHTCKRVIGRARTHARKIKGKI